MVLEVALIDVVPGREEEFATAYGKARELVASTPGCRSVRMTRGIESPSRFVLLVEPGCRSVRMTRGIESPSRFVLLVEWDSVEAHLEGFRASERFPAWRSQIGPYFASPPVVEHFIDLM